MKYIVKGIYDPSTRVVRYGVYDNMYLDPINDSGEFQNLIVLLDRKENADIICDILNKEEEQKQ